MPLFPLGKGDLDRELLSQQLIEMSQWEFPSKTENILGITDERLTLKHLIIQFGAMDDSLKNHLVGTSNFRSPACPPSNTARSCQSQSPWKGLISPNKPPSTINMTIQIPLAVPVRAPTLSACIFNKLLKRSPVLVVVSLPES
ncbi:hypothetical protein AMECASPLE_020423, partial [Ameca splendens]